MVWVCLQQFTENELFAYVPSIILLDLQRLKKKLEKVSTTSKLHLPFGLEL